MWELTAFPRPERPGLAPIAGASALNHASPAPAGRLAAIGRFRIVDVVGEGGMSVVFVAHDPELDRRVAIKLVRRELSKSRDVARDLQAEAQAIARVEHENVIRVYDVGESAEGVWIAMELVAGETLKDWLRGAPRAQPRPWREVLARFLDAAAGLAAAHAAGIVHRDFKPDNVLLREGGRAVVADFGLALTREAWLRLESDRRLGVAGTFHYLAPELFAGGVPSEASDQYSFCASLYEGLNLEVPFHASNPAAMVEEIAQGPPPSRPGVPKWLHAVVARGLSVRPEQRWPSMAALAAALADDPAVRSRRRLRTVALAAGFVVVAGAGFVAQSASVRCRGLDRDLAPVWSSPVRSRVQSTFRRSGIGYAGELWGRIAPRLDDYAAKLVAGRVAACRASAAGMQSQRLLDLRMACYAQRRDELAQVVDGLSQGGEESLRGAPRALEALGSLDGCTDARSLFYGAARPQDQVRVAESKRQLGHALLRQRQYDAGEAALREALQAGFASRDDRQVTVAALDLAEASVKRTSAPPKEAEQWLLVAKSAASTAPAQPEVSARLAAVAGEVALRHGALSRRRRSTRPRLIWLALPLRVWITRWDCGASSSRHRERRSAAWPSPARRWRWVRKRSGRTTPTPCCCASGSASSCGARSAPPRPSRWRGAPVRTRAASGCRRARAPPRTCSATCTRTAATSPARTRTSRRRSPPTPALTAGAAA